MPMRITGMNSGLDTEKIISELMTRHKEKVDMTKKSQTSLQWKQEAWKDLNTKVLKLFNGTLSSMRFSDAYSKKVTKVSDENAVSVVTGGNASNGVQEMQVKQLAKAGYLTGAELADSVTKDTTLSELTGGNIGAGEEVSFSVKTNGKTTDIVLHGSSKISDVVNQLKNAGVNANFDEANHRFFISSKTTGADAEFSLTANDANGFEALMAMGVNYNDAATVAEYKRIAEMSPTDRQAWIDSEVTKRKDALQAQIDALDKNVETMEDQVQAFKDKMVSGYRDLLENTYSEPYADTLLPEEVIEVTKIRLQGTQDDTIETWRDELKADPNRDPADVDALTDEEVADVYKKAAQDKQKELEEKLKSDPNNQSLKDELDDVKAKLTDVSAYEGRKTTLSDIATYDDLNQAITDAGPTRTALVDQKADTTAIEAAATQYVDGRIAVADFLYQNSVNSPGATRIVGQDAIINLNGAEFKSADNVFGINGLTITANKETAAGEKITLTTQNDTEGMYDMIRNFIKEYNAIINEMDKLYNAESAGAYQPLTEEEKEAMSEKEIEKWEAKAKESVLRRDSTLSTVSGAIKEVMMSGISINGEKWYLSSFGIEALSWFESADNEKNAYHIAGDPDDGFTANDDDILKGLIASDPNTVSTFFTEMSKSLYGKLQDLMMAGASQDSSSTSLYDNKRMEREYKAFTTRIAEQEKKNRQIEDRYYMQFSAMETALAKLQSKQSAITGMLGG